jgi:hypothetical protein
MQSKLPPASLYEQEYIYWPWGRLVAKVKEWVIENAPVSCYLIDYMCGTGYMLNEIAKARKDLKIEGCSITSEYIEYANKKYRNVKFYLNDALAFKPKTKPSVITATGGLHHLTWSKQIKFVEKVANELSVGGYFILGEEVIRSYRDIKSRQIAVLELFQALIREIIRSSAPENVIEAAVDLFKTDLFERGEYKNSLDNLLGKVKPYFRIEKIEKIWPQAIEPYGDYVFILKRI